jgi:hypothetical protein
MAWVTRIGGDDQKLGNLLEKFMEKESVYAMSHGDGTPRYRLNQKILMPFLDPGNLLDRTRTLMGSDWLGAPQKEALRQYLKGYELKAR